MIRRIFAFILLAAGIAFPQNPDSLYDRIIEIRSNSPELKSEEQYEKCGFGIFNTVRLHLDEFSTEKQMVLQKVLSRPTYLPLTLDSPKGFFKIHYTLDSSAQHLIDVPGYDLNELAIALDSSYNFEVNILGYAAPPSDNVAGCDDKIEVYVHNFGGGRYGYTDLDSPLGSNRWTS